MLYKSKMFRNLEQAEQAFAKILLGRDLGITPVQALQTLDLVRGNLQMRAVLLASFVRKSPDYDYKTLEHTMEKCSIEFRRKFDGEWEVMGVSTFTIEDAKKAKIDKADKPDSAWQTYPMNMLFARAMSNGVKWHCPDVLGGVPVYTEGDHIPEVELIGTADEEVPSTAVLPPAAERVLERAREIGHIGLADRATAEMTLKDQSESFVMDWCARADEELQAMETVKATPAVAHFTHPDQEMPRSALDPEGPDEPSDPNNLQGMRDHANALLDQAEIERAQGDIETASTHEDEASSLMAEADAIEADLQKGLF